MNAERRGRSRLKLRCGIRLCRAADRTIVSTETVDLNSEGFYCLSDQPFSPGELLECELLVPVSKMGLHGSSLALHRRAKVVRVEIRGLERGFGIACQFEDLRAAAVM